MAAGMTLLLHKQALATAAKEMGVCVCLVLGSPHGSSSCSGEVPAEGPDPFIQKKKKKEQFFFFFFLTKLLHVHGSINLTASHTPLSAVYCSQNHHIMSNFVCWYMKPLTRLKWWTNRQTIRLTLPSTELCHTRIKHWIKI